MTNGKCKVVCRRHVSAVLKSVQPTVSIDAESKRCIGTLISFIFHRIMMEAAKLSHTSHTPDRITWREIEVAVQHVVPTALAKSAWSAAHDTLKTYKRNSEEECKTCVGVDSMDE
jgi:hypothetical protein